MLEQPLYSLFIRMIPEGFVILLAICMLTNSKADYKNIAIASAIGGTCVYITRMMPVHFGVHTILGVIIYYLLSYKFNGVKVQKAIVGALISTILLFIADLLIVFIYKNIFILPIDLLMGKSLLSLIVTLPSLIIFYLIVKMLVYFRAKKWKDG